MFSSYKPFYYVNIDAETNYVYHSEHPNERPASINSDNKTVYDIDPHNAEISVITENFKNANAVRQRTVIKNKGQKPFTVDTLSALYQTGIGDDEAGLRPGRFIIHYAHSAWQGEAQWRSTTPEDAGLYETYNHGTQTSFRLSSQGTWTTHRYEPVLLVEDKLLGETWVFTCESGSGWAIDVNVRGQRDRLSLAVFVSGSYEKNDGWYVTLAPGETYSTCYATVSLVKGGFEEAAAELVHSGREIMKASFPGGLMPLCFNDYMNCIWALPTEEKCRALIAAAAAAGAEYYVIDAGWFGTHPNWGTSLGDWNVNDSLFGEGGLSGIFRLIEDSGMKPGIWLEIESINLASEYAKAHPDHILRRHGNIIGGGVGFLDFRLKEVRDYIESVFDRLYAMGVRFIKNDYNQTTGIGIDPVPGEKDPGSPAAELEKLTGAFRRFIDKMREKYPDLIIENCGSGAMRSDIGTLSSFHLQSISDQEDYFRMPSIIQGLEAFIPPERCGIWAYPYPSPIDDRMTFKRDRSFTEKFSDGSNTVFNMVSGLMGLMYLSGRIDMADEVGAKLIREACDVYKANRKTVMSAVPVYPTPRQRLSIDTPFTSLGLLNKEEGKLFLAVWHDANTPFAYNVDIGKYLRDANAPRITGTYPSSLPGYGAELSEGVLTVSLPCGPSAIYVALDI